MIKIHSSGYILFWKKVTFGFWHLDLTLTINLFCLCYYWSSKRIVRVLPASCSWVHTHNPGYLGPVRHACYGNLNLKQQVTATSSLPGKVPGVASRVQSCHVPWSYVGHQYSCPVSFMAFLPAYSLLMVHQSPTWLYVCATQWLF